MTETVKGEFLLDASCLNPFLEWLLCHRATETFEDKSFASLAAVFECFVADGECGFRISFLCAESYAIAAIRATLDVFPAQLQQVAETKPGKQPEH